MPVVHTQVRPRWQARMAMLVAAFLLFALLFAYDGAVAYPEHNLRAERYNTLVVGANRRQEWAELARSRNWPPQFAPEDFAPDGRAIARGKLEIVRHLVLAAACFLTAAVLLVRLVRQRRHTVRLDAEGLLLHNGRRVPVERIVEIDLRRWASRHVAVLSYTDRLGRWRRLALDGGIQSGVTDLLEQLGDRPGPEGGKG
jgi:hypothetical protein